MERLEAWDDLLFFTYATDSASSASIAGSSAEATRPFAGLGARIRAGALSEVGCCACPSNLPVPRPEPPGVSVAEPAGEGHAGDGQFSDAMMVWFELTAAVLKLGLEHVFFCQFISIRQVLQCAFSPACTLKSAPGRRGRVKEGPLMQCFAYISSVSFLIDSDCSNRFGSEDVASRTSGVRCRYLLTMADEILDRDPSFASRHGKETPSCPMIISYYTWHYFSKPARLPSWPCSPFLVLRLGLLPGRCPERPEKAPVHRA